MVELSCSVKLRVKKSTLKVRRSGVLLWSLLKGPSQGAAGGTAQCLAFVHSYSKYLLSALRAGCLG